ncbi:MAG: hypothetical protein WD451_04890 [Thermoanaerobaculia bacterium]
MSRRALLPTFALLVLFSLPLLSEILGSRRLVFRDAQITHWPWRRVAVASLAAGEVPFVNAAASGGQPLLANPNAVLLYPTFLLEHVFPPAVAFNLHYLLHILWAFFGARRLGRALGLSDGAAFFAGAVYAFSGMMLSYGSAFMNSVAAASWLPWCATAVVFLAQAATRREAVRAAAAAGLALGLQLLAGEPALTLLTLAFACALGLSEALAASRAERGRRLLALSCGGFGAGILALAFAAPLLLPLRQVFPLTYRGQHLYSERAFGAAAFSLDRAIEWLLPRFGGDPGSLGGGANWLRSVAHQDLVYIWCVTFGIIPLLAVLLASVHRGFWKRRSIVLAAGAVLAVLFSFGFSLPFYRLVYSITFLRKLRYPIKFYLLATICVALLAGLAAEALARRRIGRRGAVLAGAVLAAFAGAWALASPGGPLDRRAGPLAAEVAPDPAAFLNAFRAAVRGDVLAGSLAVLLVLLLFTRSARLREPGFALGLLTLVSSLFWGLPLFVGAPDKDLARPPALLRHLQGPGRLYVSPKLPAFDLAAFPVETPGGLPRTSLTARILVEQLIPLTGAPFGVGYVFENDPDGSYGFYNRLANEAADASTPAERDRLLALYGGRWALAVEEDEHPLWRSVTGLEVAGRRLVLFENPRLTPELRFAGRVYRRSSLSGTLELVRSEGFDPIRDVALPGRRNEDPTGEPAAGRAVVESVSADRAAASVEAAAPGHLVFSRTFLPVWKARVDGRSAPVAVANARDLAVAVPAGRHRVEIEYDRAPFRLGVALQAGAFLLAVAVAVAVATRSTLIPRSVAMSTPPSSRGA